MADIHLVGDVMVGRSFNEFLQENPRANIWGNTLSVFKPDDILIGNLETTLTTANSIWPNKAFNFKLDPTYSYILKQPNFNFLSLANNHVLDFRLNGLSSTLSTLSQLNILHAGAGIDLEQARRPAIIRLSNGIRLHIISAADHYSYWAAGSNNPPYKGKEGIFWFNFNNPINLLSYVQDYSRQLSSPDVLMVSLHWGPNWESTVSERKKYLAQQLVMSGVKIIHGHSAHHLQPVDMINDSLVFYSMGDFIDDYAIRPEYNSNIGGIATLSINEYGNLTLNNFRRTIIQDMQVNLL